MDTHIYMWVMRRGKRDLSVDAYLFLLVLRQNRKMENYGDVGRQRNTYLGV